MITSEHPNRADAPANASAVVPSLAAALGGCRLNPHLDLLLSILYEHDSLHPEHLADLRRSGLTDETIRRHRLRSVPPAMIGALLGFDIPAIRSAMLVPFPDPAGGFMDHVRLRLFPPYQDARGRTVKYLGPRGAAPRLFFALLTLPQAVSGPVPLWLVEGAKKAMAGAQLGFAAVGFEGIEGWHVGGSRELLPDFDLIALRRRIVELVPDGDARTNDNVARGAERLAEALERRGAKVRLVTLPIEVPA